MSAILNLIFGWEEIFSTTDIQRYYEIRDKLSTGKIQSKCDIVNNVSRNRNHGLNFGPNRQVMYYVYVKKQYVDIAKNVINT